MRDLSIRLEHRPGALAELGEALGRAGVSVEGGGAFAVGGTGIAHFLVEDAAAARRALDATGIAVLADREVLIQRLAQDVPGQLGALCRRMAEAGVNIEVLYSDHANQLILVVDDLEKGRRVSEAWAEARSGTGNKELRDQRLVPEPQRSHIALNQGAMNMATETWQLDNTHSSIGFTVRHMVVAKVHGRFRKYEGKLTLDGGNLEGAKVAATIDANSIDTEVEGRDAHLRSPDFFDVAAFPTLTFQSTKFEKVGSDRYRVTGDLTIRGITRPVEIDTELLGKFTDPFGNEKIALSGKTSIERKSFGLNWNKALETGGVLVGDRIDIQLEVQAVRAAAAEKAA